MRDNSVRGCAPLTCTCLKPQINAEYVGITKAVITAYTARCATCNAVKKKAPKRSDIRPIVTDRFGARYQVKKLSSDGLAMMEVHSLTGVPLRLYHFSFIVALVSHFCM